MDRQPVGRYFVFFRPRQGHSYAELATASSPLQAIERYLQEDDPEVAVLSDHSVVLRSENAVVRYAHPLECIEALYKTVGEWQIRELPDTLCQLTGVRELFCGE